MYRVFFVFTSICFSATALMSAKRKREEEDEKLLQETLTLAKKIKVNPSTDVAPAPAASDLVEVVVEPLPQPEPVFIPVTAEDVEFEKFLKQLVEKMSQKLTVDLDTLWDHEDSSQAFWSRLDQERVSKVQEDLHELDMYLGSHDVSQKMKYQIVKDIWNKTFASKKVWLRTRPYLNNELTKPTKISMVQVLLKHGADPQGNLLQVIGDDLYRHGPVFDDDLIDNNGVTFIKMISRYLISFADVSKLISKCYFYSETVAALVRIADTFDQSLPDVLSSSFRVPHLSLALLQNSLYLTSLAAQVNPNPQFNQIVVRNMQRSKEGILMLFLCHL